MENINKSLPRDVFLYLLSTVTMAISAIAFGTIIFQAINIYLPDVLSFQNIDGAKSGIRWAIASLIVVFPVYVLVMNFLEKDLKMFEEKRELKIRKWLLYFTLFAAAIVIIVDLITLIFNFLQGELTLRFFLKVLTVLFISASIFVYYRKILRPIEEIKPFILGIFPKIVIGLVIVAVAGGFAVAGLPKSQRLVRLDERRISDLSVIDSQIQEYWRRHRVLPSNFEDLRADDIVAPTDPVTNSAYEYNKIGDLNYELCAVFQTSGEEARTSEIAIPKPSSVFFDELQNHGIGRDCFSRIINPENLPPIEPPLIKR